ncbi:MAG UNVERIFIED_CONTAM: hypothetical protein LVR18_46795 [Planctomycetaceae bacterium]|jgi:hypothetical protein
MVVGGMGVSDSGTAVTRGGNLQAARKLSVVTGGKLTVNSLSSLVVDATGGGALTPATPGQLNLTANNGIKLQGLLQSVDAGSSIQLNTTQQLEIDGLIDAAGSVTAAAASYSQGPAIVVMPLILKTDSQGRLIDEQGRLIDADGYLINAAGKFVNASGTALNVPPDSPVFGGNPVRLSGGEVRTASGGSITMSASGSLLVNGAVGGLTANAGTVSATSSSVTLTSSTGDVTVTDRVAAASQLLVTGVNVNVMAGGQLRSMATGGDVRLRATNDIYIQAAVGSDPAGQVRAADFTYLQANELLLDGRVVSDSGRVRLNAVTDATIAGTITGATIEVYSGIASTWAVDRLENQAIARTDLSSHGIFIEGAGSLQSTGTVQLTSGGTISVNTGASTGSGTKTRSRPIVSTEARTSSVVTGYSQVALGTTQETEQTTVATTVTKQVGSDEFKLGSWYNKMDVVLTQDAYYNPRVPAAVSKREYFIEGIDYFNSTDALGGVTAGVPVINWSSYGLSAITSIYSNANYKTFGQLSDSQRRRPENTRLPSTLQFQLQQSEKGADA